MFKLKKIVFIIIAVIVLSGCTNSNNNKLQAGQDNKSKEISYTVNSDDGNKILSAHIILPTGEICKSISDKINQYYENIEDNYRQTIKNELSKSAKESYYNSIQNQTAFRPYNIKSDFEISYESENVISIVRNIKSYTGGLNENNEVYCDIFSKQTGEKLELKDLFSKDYDYKSNILKIIENKFNDIKNQNPDIFFDDANLYLSYALDNDMFYITKDKMVFVYPNYVLAPYSSGIQYIEIDRKDLQKHFLKQW